MLVSAEKGGKSFLRAQEKQIPEFYSSSWPYLLFQVMSCEAGLEAIGSEECQKGICGHVWAPQERGRCSVGWFVSCLVMHELWEGREWAFSGCSL